MKAITENHRQLRRYYRRVIFNRRFKHEYHIAGYFYSDVEEFDMKNITLMATRRINTNTLCSCWMCGNPRKHYGNSKASLTFQELIALDKQDIID